MLPISLRFGKILLLHQRQQSLPCNAIVNVHKFACFDQWTQDRGEAWTHWRDWTCVRRCGPSPLVCFGYSWASVRVWMKGKLPPSGVPPQRLLHREWMARLANVIFHNSLVPTATPVSATGCLSKAFPREQSALPDSVMQRPHQSSAHALTLCTARTKLSLCPVALPSHFLCYSENSLTSVLVLTIMDRCVRGKKAAGGGRTAAHRAVSVIDVRMTCMAWFLVVV